MYRALDVHAERLMVWWNVALSPCTIWASGISGVPGDGVAVWGLMVSCGSVLWSYVYEWWGSWVRWAVFQSRVVCGLLVIVAPLGVSILCPCFGRGRGSSLGGTLCGVMYRRLRFWIISFAAAKSGKATLTETILMFWPVDQSIYCTM